MNDAAERVAQAVKSGERIVVFGDFDLDGIAAAAVASRSVFGRWVPTSAPSCLIVSAKDTVCPRRRSNAYSISKPSLVVTVDCGISASPEVELLKAHGVACVVTDHHEPGGDFPIGVPVANPKLDRRLPVSRACGRRRGAQAGSGRWRPAGTHPRCGEDSPTWPPSARSPTSFRSLARTGRWSGKGCARCAIRPGWAWQLSPPWPACRSSRLRRRTSRSRSPPDSTPPGAWATQMMRSSFY